MRKTSTYELALTSLFTAIIVIMAYTPLGYIPLGVINATIISIPVILGSLFVGPKKGAFLGFVFGFTSFLKNTITPATLSAFVFSPVLAASTIGVSGVFKSTFICFVPRILVGVVPYYVYILCNKIIPKRWVANGVSFILAGICGTMTNTLLVMGGIYVLYKNAYAEAIGVAADAVLGVIGGVISFNGVIEAIVAAVLVTVVGTVLDRIKPIDYVHTAKNAAVEA